MFMVDLFKSRCWLEAENLFLRHQLNIALRRAPPRPRLRGSDRALLVSMTRLSVMNSRRLVCRESSILRGDGADRLPVATGSPQALRIPNRE